MIAGGNMLGDNMKSLLKSLLIVGLSLATVGGEAQAISKVASHLNMLEFRGGLALPHGNYGGVGTVDFVDGANNPIKLTTKELYDPTYSIGLSFGQLRQDHILYSIGFEYTHINIDDAFLEELRTGTFRSSMPSFNQYDLHLETNYQFLTLSNSSWTPFVGVSFAAGLTGQTAKKIASEYDANLVVGATMGAEFKVWQSKDSRSFTTVASTNRIDLIASGYRPKYLNLGLSLRFYARP